MLRCTQIGWRNKMGRKEMSMLRHIKRMSTVMTRTRASHEALAEDEFEWRKSPRATNESHADFSRTRTARYLHRWYLEGSAVAEIGVDASVAAFVKEVASVAIALAESNGQFEARMRLYYGAGRASEHPDIEDFRRQLRGFFEDPEFGYDVEFGQVVRDSSGHADCPCYQTLIVKWW